MHEFGQIGHLHAVWVSVCTAHVAFAHVKLVVDDQLNDPVFMSVGSHLRLFFV